MTARNETDIWRAKLAAWTHDPAEKALVLLRDPEGHEGGTVQALQQALFGGSGIPAELVDLVRRADWWAAAADRPQFPQIGGRYADWAQVRFTEEPVLVHPLSGRSYRLSKLNDVAFQEARAVSLDHFERLIVRDGETVDVRRTFLSFWRKGPASPHPGLGVFWEVLPADTRVPDHAIWDHLQLTSAFAGAMAADPLRHVALLAVTIGPVQSFIEQGRSTSDLWAGSHLLSRLAWEALAVVCEHAGPDAVIFPHLRGVPLVDLWLRTLGIDAGEGELDHATDANPAFVASLPNRFVAIVPESQAEGIARTIEDRLRAWVRERTQDMVRELAGAAGLAEGTEGPLREQAMRQLQDFPEIYWAAVPWRLAGEGREVEPEGLHQLIDRLVSGTPEGGLLGTESWRLLSREVALDGAAFYRPNPGVLYPDLHLVLERVLAVAKSTRLFAPACEEGYRCSICGEREWLTDDRAALRTPRSERGGSIWTRVARKNASWSRKGEHLCALCALKRLWPALFAVELSRAIGQGVQRYVVSTHTMALSPTLDRLIEVLYGEKVSAHLGAYRGLADRIQTAGVDDFVALPKRLGDKLTCHARIGEEQQRIADTIRKVPALLERLAEEEDEESAELQKVRDTLRQMTGAEPERYYALILLDGDRMGEWLSGSRGRNKQGAPTGITFQESWHPAVREQAASLARQNPALNAYLTAVRPSSPARHIFISRALNGFALHLARLIVEECYNGKLLYAGGDDLLAMVAIDDLLEMLMALRCAYSGVAPGEDVELNKLLGRERPGGQGPRVRLGGDHALLDGGSRRLLRMMGCRATLSAGAVIAHYSAPLGAVLRELRAAERRAKSREHGGRDAFSITLMKRAGGWSHFTSKWFAEGAGSDPRRTSIGAVLAVRDALVGPLGRRAIYHVISWLEHAGPAADHGQLATLLEYQFRRQAKPDSGKAFDPAELAEKLAGVAVASVQSGRGSGVPRVTPVEFVKQALVLAEFLARNGRAGSTGEN